MRVAQLHRAGTSLLGAAAFFRGSSALASALASDQAASNTSTAPAWPIQTFISEPELHPLKVNTTVVGKPSNGYLFIATDGPVAAKNGGPLIVDEDGEPVYISEGHAFNFGPQMLNGKPVLTWWNGSVFPEPVGRGYGNILIADNTYQVIHNVSLEGNFQTLNKSETFASNIDLHEVFVTDRGSIVVTGNNVTTADLTSVGGPSNGFVVDSQVYEIDIETNEVLFSWKSLDHLDQLPFTESVYPLGTEGFTGKNQSVAWGYFHINTASPFEDGYLLSSRYFCSVIAISKTGHVKWRVQGKTGGDFKLASDAHFCFQHHARHIATHGPVVEIGLHDNANSPLTEPNPTTPSSGLVLELDLEKRTAEAKARYRNKADHIYASAQGSYQSLRDGHVLLGHGFVPEVEEFDRHGKIVATTQFGTVVDGQSAPVGGILSYRAFKSEWMGCPTQPPAVVAVRNGEDCVEVAVSWNGATEVQQWAIFAGRSKDHLKEVRIVPKKGFETKVSIGHAAYVQVEARGGHGCGHHSPRRSKVVASR